MIIVRNTIPHLFFIRGLPRSFLRTWHLPFEENNAPPSPTIYIFGQCQWPYDNPTLVRSPSTNGVVNALLRHCWFPTLRGTKYALLFASCFWLKCDGSTLGDISCNLCDSRTEYLWGTGLKVSGIRDMWKLNLEHFIQQGMEQGQNMTNRWPFNTFMWKRNANKTAKILVIF